MMEKNYARFNVDEMGQSDYQIVNGHVYPRGSYLNSDGKLVTWYEDGSVDVRDDV